MSYWHTCPGCAVDQTRRPYGEPDRGTLCELCSDSRTYALGYEAAVRGFWRGVCERLAKEADDESASLEGDSCGYPQMSQRTRDWYQAEARAKAAEAARLRAWAKEGV